MPWSSILKNVALGLAIIAGLWLVFNVRLPSMDALQAEIADLNGWGYAFFVVLYSAVAATPIPVTIMALVGGMAFGLPIGTALSMIGVVIGSSIGYWIARGLGRETVMRLLGQHATTVEDRLKDGGFYAVSLLRLMPGFPYWPVNYGSGAFGIDTRPFLTATVISSIPGQISLVAVGAFIGEPNVANGIAVVLAWILVIGLTIVAFLKFKKVNRAEVAAEKPSDGESAGGASASSDTDAG